MLADIWSQLLTWAGEARHVLDQNEGAVAAVAIPVTIGLALLVFKWPWRAWGVAILCVSLVAGALIILAPEPVKPDDQKTTTVVLEGQYGYKVEIPVDFTPNGRNTPESQLAATGPGDIVDFRTGSYQGSPADYLNETFAPALKEVCDLTIAGRYSVGLIYPDPASGAPTDHTILSWTDETHQVDYYDVRVAVASGRVTHWAHAVAKIHLPNRVMFTKDYETFLHSIRDSAGISAAHPGRHSAVKCPQLPQPATAQTPIPPPAMRGSATPATSGGTANPTAAP